MRVKRQLAMVETEIRDLRENIKRAEERCRAQAVTIDELEQQLLQANAKYVCGPTNKCANC